MDLGSLFLILALLLLVAAFIGRPLFEKTRLAPETATPAQQADHERSALLAERDRLLNALQELDFDYALGKIPQEDYPAQRAALLQQGADVLRRLDAMQPETQSGDAEARLEAAIAARRADAAVSAAGVLAGNGNGHSNGRKHSVAVASPDDTLEALLANRRRERQGKAAGFCHKCGGPVQKTDRFCPKCGAKTA